VILTSEFLCDLNAEERIRWWTWGRHCFKDWINLALIPWKRSEAQWKERTSVSDQRSRRFHVNCNNAHVHYLERKDLHSYGYSISNYILRFLTSHISSIFRYNNIWLVTTRLTHAEEDHHHIRGEVSGVAVASAGRLGSDAKSHRGVNRRKSWTSLHLKVKTGDTRLIQSFARYVRSVRFRYVRLEAE
jgi:hypothetical protein